MYWHPMQNELQDWIDKKILEFVIQENISSKLSAKYWAQKYIYTKIHEIFFSSFTTEPQEWLSRLTEFHTCAKDDMITQWTSELVQQLEKTSNKITRVVDRWIDHVLGGFVTKFFIDQFVSYF